MWHKTQYTRHNTSNSPYSSASSPSSIIYQLDCWRRHRHDDCVAMPTTMKAMLTQLLLMMIYEDDNGNKVFDLEAMAEKFENELTKVVGVTVMCSVSED